MDRVAVRGSSRTRPAHRALYREPITLAKANALLLQEGFRGVLRFDEGLPGGYHPVLGTGKVDYKVLRARLRRSHCKPNIMVYEPPALCRRLTLMHGGVQRRA